MISRKDFTYDRQGNRDYAYRRAERVPRMRLEPVIEAQPLTSEQEAMDELEEIEAQATVKALMYLTSPGAERLDDGYRITELCKHSRALIEYVARNVTWIDPEDTPLGQWARSGD